MLGWLRNLLARLAHAPRESVADGPSLYQGLRTQALSVDRASAGLAAVPSDAPVWGLLMEMGFPEGVATLFARIRGMTRPGKAGNSILRRRPFFEKGMPMRRLFIALVFALALAAIPACGDAPADPVNGVATMYPVIDPGDPASIKKWEASQHNAFRSKIEVVNLACFRDPMTEKGHPDAKPVAVQVRGALDSGVSAELQTALQQFKDTEPALYAKARAAIYAEYRKSYNTYKQALSMGAMLYGGRNADVEKMLPKIVKGNELDGLISFQTIDLYRGKDGAARVGIVLGVPWDEEHGMGVVMARGEVERVGDAGVVYLP